MAGSNPVSDDVTQKHVTPPAGDKCDSCEENVIDSFCHQCKQWLCKYCKKVHGKLTATKSHTYTVLTEKQQQLKTDLNKNINDLKQKSEKLQISVTKYESAIKQLMDMTKNIKDKSKALRKSFHEDIDNYFDAIDERIDNNCNPVFRTLTVKSVDVIAKMKACHVLTAKMDTLITQERRPLAEGEDLLSQAEELFQSLTDPSFIDAVEIPQVRLERG